MRRARASLITGVLVATLAGCGSNAANEVVVAAGAPTKSAAPAVGPEDDDQAETNALRSDYERRLTTWLQSDEIRNLDLRKVTQVEEERDAPGGYDSLEEAVDLAQATVGEGDFTSSKAEIAGIEAGTPYYDIRRETGQFMSENGKVREAKGNHGSIDVDGLSEDSLMDRAEARAKKKSS